jgi:hypothetical protein
MTQSGNTVAVAQDPRVVAAIGPYEVLPKVEGADEVWLGTDGAISPAVPDEPVFWREVVALRIWLPIAEGDGLTIEVDTGPTALAPDARVGGTPLCFGLPGEALDRRARLVADQLLRYYVDQGVPRGNWPKIDLTPQSAPEPTPEEWQALADQILVDYEAVCPRGTDPVLGRYVEVAASRSRWWLWASLAWLVGGGLLYLLLVGYPIDRHSLELYLGIVLMALAIGLYWSTRGLRAWPLRHRRVRVGTDGLEVLPDTGPIAWSQVDEVDVDSGEFYLTLTVETGLGLEGRGAAKALVKRSRYRYVFKLPKMMAPAGVLGLYALIGRLHSAFKGRQP